MAVDEVRPGYKRTEVGVIPEDWSISTIAADFDIELGKRIDAPNNFGDLKPIITNIGVQWGLVDLETITPVPLTPRDIARYRLRSGDLLLCEGGEVGRSAIWEHDDVECYHQNTLHRLRRIRSASPRFLRYLFEMWSLSGVLERFATQTSIAHLTKEALSAMPWPAPQRSEEQELIAGVLDSCESLVQQVRILLAKKRDLKRAVMQELLRPRANWRPFQLGELGSFLKGSGVSKADAKGGTIPCVRYGEIYTDHHYAVRKFRSHISEGVAEQAQALKRGDILFAGSGETREEIGKCVAYLEDHRAYAGGDIVILRPSRGNSLFLSYVLASPELVRQKAALGQGDAVVHIGANALARLRLHLPAMEEQVLTVAVLSDMDAEITALEARLAKYRDIKQSVMQNLLTGAIRLV